MVFCLLVMAYKKIENIVLLVTIALNTLILFFMFNNFNWGILLFVFNQYIVVLYYLNRRKEKRKVIRSEL